MDKKNSTYNEFYKQKEDAILELVAKYRYPLIFFTRGYVKNKEIAEDIVSDAFVKLMLKKQKIQDCNCLKTYLYSIAKNMSLDYLRKNKRKKAYIFQTEQTENEELNPENILYKNERQKTLIKCMIQLKDDYRSALYLQYFEELSVEAISKVMKKNKKQIYNLLERAKNVLEILLKKEGINEN
jgi:RNA polymerase sigma-70 factor (ECF subfamily)